jgi:hypothetical protein
MPLVIYTSAHTYHLLVARDRAQGPARNQREEARVARQGRVTQVRVQPVGIQVYLSDTPGRNLESRLAAQGSVAEF